MLEYNYKYIIEPINGYVIATIYKSFEMANIPLTSRKFGKWYRNTIEKDYINAKNWSESQLRYIHFANKKY